jgi:hypothetical protein
MPVHETPPLAPALSRALEEAELRLLASAARDGKLAAHLCDDEEFLDLFASPEAGRRARHLAAVRANPTPGGNANLPCLPPAPERVEDDLALLRLARTARRAHAYAEDLTREATAALAEAMEHPVRLRERCWWLDRRMSPAWKTGEDLARETVGLLEVTHEEPLTTGFDGLDVMAGGLPPSSLVLLRGLPSSGRTTFGLQVALRAARQGVRVLWLAYGETVEDVGVRALALLGSFPQGRLRRAKVARDEWVALAAGMAELEELPFVVVSTRSPSTVEGVWETVHEARPRLVVIDDVPWAGQKLHQAMEAGGRAVGALGASCWVTTHHLQHDAEEACPVDVDMTLLKGHEEDDLQPHAVALEISRSRFGPRGALDLRWDPERACFEEWGLSDLDGSG